MRGHSQARRGGSEPGGQFRRFMAKAARVFVPEGDAGRQILVEFARVR